MRRVLAILLILAASATVAYFWMVFTRPYKNFPSAGVFVTVPRGASQRAVARILKSQGVIRSAVVFEAYCRWRAGRSLKAGDYFFDHAVTPREVYDALANGRVYIKTVSIPEGYTMAEIAALLEQQGIIPRAAFLSAGQDTSLIADLAPQARNLEGFLFPATYPFPRHPSPQDVAAAMTRRFRETWARLTTQTGTGGRSVEEVVTMASLVEKETPLAEERPLVAAVFLNRLRLGRPLQCDPTVRYALQLEGRANGSLTLHDLRLDSPYNTYRHTGLPPGPIANPGEEALRAALEPAQSHYLYFVANTQGGHFFSRTLAEHNQNVKRYRQLQAEANGAKACPPRPQPARDPQKRRRKARRDEHRSP